MNDRQRQLAQLLSWLSPAFPVGAFAYSHGIERAIHDGLIDDRETLIHWICDLTSHGSGWNDAVLLAEAWRSAGIDGGSHVAELARAMAGTRERHMETLLQGAAFAEAMATWDSCCAPAMTGTAENHPYPVAVGLGAARHGIELQSVLTAYLHAFASNLIQAAVRLVPLGQRDGVAAMARLEPLLLMTALRAAGASLDDLGSSTFMSEIMAMKHEVQYSRVFRS